MYLCLEYTTTRLVFALLVAAAGFFFNSLMALLIYLHEQVVTTQNRLVLNLCLNNMVFCCYVLPVYVYDLSQGLQNKWGVFCEIQGFIFMFVQCNVILAYLHITLHRYFTIVFARTGTLGYGSARRTWMIVTFSSLLLAAVMSLGLVHIWGRYGQSHSSGICTLLSDKDGGEDGNFKLFGNLLAILLPLLAMAYCYGHILYTMRRHSERLDKGMHAALKSGEHRGSPTSDGTRNKRRSREVYVTVLSVSIVAVFVVSYVPYLVAQHVTSFHNWVMLHALSGALAYIHALTDPLIYVLGDSRLRKLLQQVASKSNCCAKSGKHVDDNDGIGLEEKESG